MRARRQFVALVVFTQDPTRELPTTTYPSAAERRRLLSWIPACGRIFRMFEFGIRTREKK
jgi:hypothetical protein